MSKSRPPMKKSQDCEVEATIPRGASTSWYLDYVGVFALLLPFSTFLPEHESRLNAAATTSKKEGQDENNQG